MLESRRDSSTTTNECEMKTAALAAVFCCLAQKHAPQGFKMIGT